VKYHVINQQESFTLKVIKLINLLYTN